MNSLLFLNEQDFSIQQGKKGHILCNNLPGLSLVLFYSTRCEYCPMMVEIFKKLPHYVPGCQFALLNISTYQNVAWMSQKTIAPITYVPFVVLYVNGRPFMKYNGEKRLQDIAGFVNEVLSRIQNKKNFSSSNIRVENEETIPEYCSGIPFNLVCEGEMCYLSFAEAYKK